MKRRNFLGLAATSVAVVACGAPPVRLTRDTPAPPVPTTAPAPVVAPATGLVERILVRETISGASHITGIDPAAGKKLFTMPMGQPMADGSRWLALSPSSGTTVIELFNAMDGTVTSKISIPGLFNESAISHDDHWLLLVQPPDLGAESTTRLALVELKKGAVVDNRTLPGLFHVDAVDASGLRLYLIEPHPEKKANAYQVMLFDRIEGVLSRNPIADKRSGQKIMSGTKVRHAWSASGDWLYSLYLDPGTSGDGAFVHALNVAEQYAACIDLPARDPSAAMLHQYALAASPATHRYFAINPALESLSYFNEGDWNAISNDLHLPGGNPAQASPPASRDSTRQAVPDYNNSLVTPDGKVLFAGSATGILRIPIVSGTMQPSDVWLRGRPVLSIGMGSTGKALYALLDGSIRRLLAIDPNSGTVLGDLTGLVTEPTGIEEVLSPA